MPNKTSFNAILNIANMMRPPTVWDTLKFLLYSQAIGGFFAFAAFFFKKVLWLFTLALGNAEPSQTQSIVALVIACGVGLTAVFIFERMAIVLIANRNQYAVWFVALNGAVSFFGFAKVVNLDGTILQIVGDVALISIFSIVPAFGVMQLMKTIQKILASQNERELFDQAQKMQNDLESSEMEALEARVGAKIAAKQLKADKKRNKTDKKLQKANSSGDNVAPIGSGSGNRYSFGSDGTPRRTGTGN